MFYLDLALNGYTVLCNSVYGAAVYGATVINSVAES